MGLIEVLGLPFTSVSHFAWFLIAMVTVALVLVAVSGSIVGDLHKLLPFFLSTGFGIAFMFVSLEADRVTKGGLQAIGGYTTDCIWFNKYMSVGHFAVAGAVLIWLIVSHLKKTRTEAPRE